MDSCAHVESCLAAAEAAECPLDWSNFLVQYVTLLARQGDTSRLEALCSSLLGPLSWKPSSCVAMAADPRSSWAGGVDLIGAGGSGHVSSSGVRIGLRHPGREMEALAVTGHGVDHRQNGYSGTGECEGQGVYIATTGLPTSEHVLEDRVHISMYQICSPNKQLSVVCCWNDSFLGLKARVVTGSRGGLRQSLDPH